METSAEKLHRLIKIMFFVASAIIIVFGIIRVTEFIKIYTQYKGLYSFTFLWIKTKSILVILFVNAIAVAFIIFVNYLTSLLFCAVMEFFIDVHRYTIERRIQDDHSGNMMSSRPMSSRPMSSQGKPTGSISRPNPSSIQ